MLPFVVDICTMEVVQGFPKVWLFFFIMLFLEDTEK